MSFNIAAGDQDTVIVIDLNIENALLLNNLIGEVFQGCYVSADDGIPGARSQQLRHAVGAIEYLGFVGGAQVSNAGVDQNHQQHALNQRNTQNGLEPK